MVCPTPMQLWAKNIPKKYEVPLRGEINKRLRVCCSRSATTVATLPPRQLKNKAAPTRVEGAALSKALAVVSLARSAKINPLSNRTEIGKIPQKIKLRRRRHNSIKILCATARVSCQYFISR